MIQLAKPFFSDAEETAVCEVLKSGNLSSGQQVKCFEEEIATYVGRQYGVAVNSGTAALHCALHALGIGPGDEVITTPFTFVATVNAILFCNAKPVFVDIDEKTYNINPDNIKEKITQRTKAIIVVDLFGQACDYGQIEKIAAENKLFLIEDACQSFGAEHFGRKAGSFGDIAVFSFYATKNITCGEGGMLVTNNLFFAKKARELRSHGQKEGSKSEFQYLGYNYRMTEMQAALGREQFKKKESFLNRRRGNAIVLSQALSGLKQIKIPEIREGNIHAFNQYSIRTSAECRDALGVYLKGKGVETGIFYPKPLHFYEHLQEQYKRGDFPVAEKCAKEILSLPVHPLVSEADIVYVGKCIREFYEKN